MSGVQEPTNEFGGNNATLMLDPQNSATTNFKLNIPILFGNVATGKRERKKNNKKNMLDFCLLTFALILEHIGYSIVIRCTRRVKHYVERPTEVIHLFLLSQKCLQCCAIFWFGRRHQVEFVLRPDVTLSDLWPGLGGIFVGQFLTLSVYRAIGRRGVYLCPIRTRTTIRHDVSVQLDGPSPVPWRLVNVGRGDLLGIRDDGAHGIHR